MIPIMMGEKTEIAANKEGGVSKIHRTLVPCKACGGKIFKVSLTPDLLETVERFPFQIVMMHVNSDKGSYYGKEVHTLVALIDKEMHCRHVEVLSGKQVFITPYILYNPELLQLTCNKNMSKF